MGHIGRVARCASCQALVRSWARESQWCREVMTVLRELDFGALPRPHRRCAFVVGTPIKPYNTFTCHCYWEGEHPKLYYKVNTRNNRGMRLYNPRN